MTVPVQTAKNIETNDQNQESDTVGPPQTKSSLCLFTFCQTGAFKSHAELMISSSCL